MPNDLASLLLIFVSFAATFAASRWLSRHWRKKRRDKDIAAARAGESRQVRRARERRGAPR